MSSGVTSNRWPLGAGTVAAPRAVAMVAYVTIVTAFGAALLASVSPLAFDRSGYTLALLGAALLLSVFKLRLPLSNGVSTMTLAYAVDFVALVALGTPVAMTIAAASVLMQCTVRVRRPQPFYRTAFSVASVVIAVQTAAPSR